MPEHVTEASLDRALDGVKDLMQSGFDGVNQRLDKLNGSVARHEDKLQAHELRLAVVSRGLAVPVNWQTVSFALGVVVFLGIAAWFGPAAAVAFFS